MGTASLEQVRHEYIDVGNLRMHYVTQGEGPLMLMLQCRLPLLKTRLQGALMQFLLCPMIPVLWNLHSKKPTMQGS